MKQIIPTTQYKKDLKRYANQRKKMEALLDILRCLANEEPIPENCRPHMLTGQYKGCMECHVGGDFLLIWIEDDIISLVRLGSHSELFGQKSDETEINEKNIPRPYPIPNLGCIKYKETNLIYLKHEENKKQPRLGNDITDACHQLASAGTKPHHPEIGEQADE